MTWRALTASMALVALAGLAVGCGGSDRLSKKLKQASTEPVPKVPYVVSGSKNSNDAKLWGDAERSAKKAAHTIPGGTQVSILERKELDRSRGGTMCKVRAVTGEEGWIPEKFIEYRLK